MTPAPTTSAAALEGRGLVKAFGPTPALRGVDLRLEPGEILAVTGPSGSGKSTLLHCLAGILRPDAGEVHLGGGRIDVRPEGERSALRRTRLGVVFQFGQLVAELTAEENAALPLLLGAMSRRSALGRAREWLERLGAGSAAGRRPGELSGGEAQRVALARALVTGPDVVLADEPTGALDSLASEQVVGILVEAARSTGAAVLLVTHDATVAAHGDREVVLRDGRVAVPAGAAS